MAIFKIIESIPKSNKLDTSLPKFKVEVLSGDIRNVKEFTLFEAHHRCVVKILRFEIDDNFVILHISLPLGWSNQHVGTIIDTEDDSVAKQTGRG